MNLADGAVKGIDIAGTLRGVKDKINVLKSQQTTVEGDKSKKTDFSEMVASFTIKNGVAHNEDLSMKAPLFRITGNGDIDIANETINYTAKPTVVNSLKGQGGAGLEELSGLTIPGQADRHLQQAQLRYRFCRPGDRSGTEKTAG